MTGTDGIEVPAARPGRRLKELDDTPLVPEVRAFAEHLRKLREWTGLNSTALAAQLGTDASSLSRYLNGDRLPPLVWLRSLQDWVAENTDTRLSEQERKRGRELLYAAAARVKNHWVVHEIEMAMVEELWAERISECAQAISDILAELAEEHEHRQRLKQKLDDSDAHNVEQFRLSQQRIAELEDRLGRAEALLGLRRAERLSFAELAVRSSATLAAYESGAVTDAPAASAPAETASGPKDLADRVSRLLMDGHVEDVDRLLTGEAARMTDPREFLITMGCLRQNDCYREAEFLSRMVGQHWSPILLAQLLAMRADKKNWDLLTSGHDGHDLSSMVRADERSLVHAVAGRQDNDLVELAERLRGKHLDKISTVMLVMALYRRSRPGRKALIRALRTAGLVEEASAAKKQGPKLEHGWNPVEECEVASLAAVTAAAPVEWMSPDLAPEATRTGAVRCWRSHVKLLSSVAMRWMRVTASGPVRETARSSSKAFRYTATSSGS